MVFHKTTKKAFVFPTKTGTFTAMHFLKNIGWKFLGGPHQFYEFFAEKYPNLYQYQVYCFFRNPLARFESAILHVKQMPYSGSDFQGVIDKNKISKTVETISYDEVIDIFSQVSETFEMLFKPQVAWLAHSNIQALDFDNYEAELRRVTENADQPIVRYNTSTDFGRSVITDKVREFVRDYYAADYQFAKDVLGKEY
jgi:hypothetical protein